MRPSQEIDLAPGVPLPKKRKVQSIMLLGGQRSGKTVGSARTRAVGVDRLVIELDGGGVYRLSWPYEEWPE